MRTGKSGRDLGDCWWGAKEKISCRLTLVQGCVMFWTCEPLPWPWPPLKSVTLLFYSLPCLLTFSTPPLSNGIHSKISPGYLKYGEFWTLHIQYCLYFPLAPSNLSIFFVGVVFLIQSITFLFSLKGSTLWLLLAYPNSNHHSSCDFGPWLSEVQVTI